MPSAVELGDRRAGVGLGPVDEGEEPDQLADRARRRRLGSVEPGARRASRRPRRGRRRRTAARAWPRGSRGDVDAAREHRLGRALGDQQVVRRRRPRRRPTRAGARGRTAAGRAARSAAGPSAARSGGRVGRRPQRDGRARSRRPARASVRVASLHTSPSSERLGVAAARPRRATRSKVIAPSVSVPVLSVKSTSMLPRSSIVTRRLTSTLRRASSREPVDEADADDRRQQLRGDADRDRQREQQRVDQRPRQGDVDDEDRDGQHAGDPDQQLARSRCSPTWKAVSAWRSPRPTAILPNAVAEPVETTTPRAEPWCTTVPMNAHDGQVDRSESPPGAARRTSRPASTRRSAPPRRTRAASTSSSRTSAGTRSPTPQRDDVAGHEVADVDRAARRRRATPRASWRMLACSAATARSERYSLTKPSPTLSTTIAAMIAASVGSPVSAGDRGRGEQQDQQRVAQLADEHAERRHATNLQRVRAVHGEAHRSLRGGQSLWCAVEPGTDGLGREGAGAREVELGLGVHRAIVTGAPYPAIGSSPQHLRGTAPMTPPRWNGTMPKRQRCGVPTLEEIR